MKMEEFDRIFNAVVTVCNHFEEFAWLIPADHIYESMMHDQQILIQVGTLLEQLGYEEAPVIRTIEEMCEDMYWQNYGDIETRIQMLPQLKIHLEEAAGRLLQLTEGDALSIVTIVKNEAADIREWLEFHRMMGVTHFYIYDNESEDELKSVLQPYVDAGIVTYIWWPGSNRQLAAYNDALDNYKDCTCYMAMLDADEFLMPVENVKLLDVIAGIFTQNFYAGCIGVNWREYGSSGMEYRSEGLLTETHLYRGDDDFMKNAHIKAVCNPRKVKKFVNPHFPEMNNGSMIISEEGTMINLSYRYERSCKKLRINHYYIKSKDEFFAKARRGWPDQVNYEKREADIAYNFALYESGLNAVYDPIMERYLPELKRRLGVNLI